MQKFTKNPKFRGAENAKRADFDNPESQKLISRKNMSGRKIAKFTHCAFAIANYKNRKNLILSKDF